MVSGRDISWSEGQFIQPHHFQQAALHAEGHLGDLIRDYQPHGYGVAHISIADGDCENYVLHILELECRLTDGTRIRFPENAVIESRSFKDIIDTYQGRVEVFLGLPIITELEPNCLRFNQTPMGGIKYRYVTKVIEANDVNSGSNPQQLEVKLFNPKILFSGESTYGYEAVKIAEVERSAKYGSTPKIRKEFVPPTITLSSSPLLLNVMRETGNRLLAKNRILRSYWKHKNTATLMKARDALKVQAIAAATNAFMQFSSIDRIHPFTIYLKMAEIIGMLSIYSENDAHVEVPTYDHDNLGECFSKAESCIVKLLAMLEEASFESRVFEPKDGMLACPIEMAWFDEKYELYICFESKQDEAEVTRQVYGLKISPESHMALLNQRRIRGMDTEGPIHHLPALPASPHHHYYRVSKQHPLFEKLRENPILSIWGPFQFSELTTLFIVERSS